VDLIDELDGFNLLPRLSIPFDAPIDATSATSESVLLVRLGDERSAGDAGARVVGINRVVWDPDTDTLHAEADELLDPHTRYALIVTNALPSLLNSPGLTQIDGVAVSPPYFNENLPLRNQPPLSNTVAGAMDIQEVLDRMKWVTQSASSLAYAPYLRRSPLAGAPAKSVLIQFSVGDMRATNPSTTALLRAGDLADRTTYYRNDLAFAENPAVPKDPHLLIRNVTLPSVAATARAVQEQIAMFLASDGATMAQPEPSRYFEVPIAGPLPEGLNFIP
jgi:hypothetical protein